MTLNRFLCFTVLILLLNSCAQPIEQESEESKSEDEILKPVGLTAQEIVAESYTYHGCERINSASITFDFRKYHFEFLHTDTGLVRSRSFSDTIGNTFKDVWARNSFFRYKNDKQIEISEEKKLAYKNSINSVFYFAYLPKSLLDPAVKLTYLDTVELKDKKYHKIKVTFSEEGGGQDYEDQFIYWFDTQDYSMDYLAYSYETNGGGMRFRSFTNRRKINGILIQDYLNFAPPEGAEINELDALFSNDRLDEVSVIELEDVTVD
jgi:hypothetical protein